MRVTTGCHYSSDNGLSLEVRDMAYPIVTGSILELTLEGRHEGQQVMNVLHYKLTSPATLTDGRDVAANVIIAANEVGGIATLWRACLSIQVTDLTAKAQWIVPDRYAYVRLGITGGSGSVAGDAMPVNTAVTVTRRGQEANRRNIGSTHIGGVPAGAITNGQLNILFVDAYAEFAAKMLQPLLSLDPAFEMTPILYNKEAPAESAVPIAYTLNTYARIMRRRTVGVGA